MEATFSNERVLGIDYGERRIGLALAAPGHFLVRGLPTLDLSARRDDPVPAIVRIVGEHEVDRIVVGIPYTLAGEEGPQATEVRAFQARLAAAVEVPVEDWDERLTSEAARRRLQEMGYDEKATRQRVDQLSAVLMLEGWLTRHGASGEAAGPAFTPTELRPPELPSVAPPGRARSGPRRDERSRRGRLALLFLALAALAIAGLCWASAPPSAEGAPILVTVEPGTTVRGLARELEERGIVRSALLLEAWLRLRGDAGRIQAGTYALRRDQNLLALADQLVAGETVLAAATVPEGLRIEETAGIVARALGVDSASFVAVALDSTLVDSLLPASLIGAEPSTLEGYLFPETYRVDPAIEAPDFARVMVAQFWRVVDPAARARAESLQMTVHQIVTLASIVEEEAKVDDERKTIAGVFWNRLRRGMPLEADPTVQYALGSHKERVLYEDLNVESPYNTYRNPGLPPGPIASPGRASIEASLYPDSVPYLYFFATGEGGKHTFSATYDEHLRKRRELGR
ncbi:MAG: endolytic transglycosylase MltG [Gemmatimonadota bacterium]